MDRPELKTLESEEFYQQLNIRERQYLHFLNLPLDIIHLIAHYAVSFNIFWPEFGKECTYEKNTPCKTPQGIEHINILFNSVISWYGNSIIDCLSDFTWHFRYSTVCYDSCNPILPDDAQLEWDGCGFRGKIQDSRRHYIVHGRKPMSGKLVLMSEHF
jgi:hypothetical protein